MLHIKFYMSQHAVSDKKIIKEFPYLSQCKTSNPGAELKMAQMAMFKQSL